jgi:beta-mannosidase
VEAVSSNNFFFAPYRYLALPSVDWETSVEKLGERSFELTLEANAFAKGVWLRLDSMAADFEDNFFDAPESVPVKVRLTTETDAPAETIQRRLLIRTVADVG